MKNHGREEPTFILTNDFNLTKKQIITKYARRWLVEQEIAEELDFFHLNLLSSSIVIKVDFDLIMTILANTLYKILARQLPGFEKEKAKTLYTNFIHNGADIKIKNNEIDIQVLKKSHNPIIMSSQIFRKPISISWLNNFKLLFSVQSTT
jgi:hypothetical protein